MPASSRDHLEPSQLNNQEPFQPFQHFPHSRSLSLHARFDGPTGDETPLTTKRSLLHRARRSILSFSSPSPQAFDSPASNAPKRPIQDESHRPDVKRTMPSSLAYSGASATRTLNENAHSYNASLRGSRPGFEDLSSGDEGRPKNEDVFLNIARTDYGRRDSMGRSDFRRSRLGYSSQSLRSPTSEQTPSPDQRYSNADNPLLSQNDSPTAPYSSIHTPSSSVHPLDDPSRFRYSSLGSGSRSTIGVPRSRFSRTSPETSPRTPSVAEDRRSSLHESRNNRSSGLSTIHSSRQPSASEAIGRPRADTTRSRAGADGTESTLSTTAPSTVWDELDDLKDRIKKLELTGRLPPSSSAAMYSPTNERPRTANTAITTLSSSPKNYRKTSQSPADTEKSPVHPILQSALAKAKGVLSGDVYSSLEATITDALNLSTALGVNTAPSGSVSVVNGGYSSPERHARRKADSVCRSLTELCLALTDEQLRNHRPSSSSREAGMQPQLPNGSGRDSRMSMPAYQRNGIQDSEGIERRHSTTRISSRLEARRASLINTSPGNTMDTKQSPAQSPGIPTPTSRLNRMSTSLRTRRQTIGEDSGETESPHSRSVSRANTEIGTPIAPQSNPPPLHRFSQGHTVSRSVSGMQQDHALSPRSPQHQPSQVPQPQTQPQPQPRTPTLSSNLSFRRSYISPASYTPATSRANIQAGSRRYGLTSSFSSNNIQSSAVEDTPRSPRQMEPSQTRISMPSSKMATSYTPLQSPRLRANSLSARRFGLRTRAPATPNNNVNLDDSID
ncbi:hypothetical protein N7461_005583 [Penicillium sp. DV-2018c]|nr:hypothetical protein N7461_005583 [Penicillium sp. DV-2018c]